MKQVFARKEEATAEARHSTPKIFVHDRSGALEFYKRTFGAVERSLMMSPAFEQEDRDRGHRNFDFDEFSASEWDIWARMGINQQVE